MLESLFFQSEASPEPCEPQSSAGQPLLVAEPAKENWITR